MGSGQLYKKTSTTEQLYRQLVVPNTADRGSGVPNVPAINYEGGFLCFYCIRYTYSLASLVKYSKIRQNYFKSVEEPPEVGHNKLQTPGIHLAGLNSLLMMPKADNYPIIDQRLMLDG